MIVILRILEAGELSSQITVTLDQFRPEHDH